MYYQKVRSENKPQIHPKSNKGNWKYKDVAYESNCNKKVSSFWEKWFVIFHAGLKVLCCTGKMQFNIINFCKKLNLNAWENCKSDNYKLKTTSARKFWK